MMLCRLLLLLIGFATASCSTADQNYFSRFLDYMTWDQQLPSPPTPTFITFIQQNTPLARKLREKWLYDLAQQQDWARYTEYYQPSNDVSLQCYAAYAWYQQGEKQRAIEASNEQWLSGESKPPACDKLFTFLLTEKIYAQANIEQRMLLALERQNFQLADYLANKMVPKNHWVNRIHKNPKQISQLKTHTPINQALYLYGLKRLLPRNPQVAIKLWQMGERNQQLNPEQSQAFIDHTALYKAAHNDDDAEQWFAKLDKAHQTDHVLEWKIRFALKRQNWPSVQQLIHQLSNKESLCWQYWLARALAAQGQTDQAKSIYQTLATNRQYYGFLASYQLRQPFRFHHEESMPDHSNVLTIYQPILKQIRELYLSRQIASASRLTNDFASELPKPEKSAFIHWIARELHWYAKSVYLSDDETLTNQLTLRFPLAYLDVIKQQADYFHLPAALVYAVIRQESAFRTEVVSSAGAHGLMQLMPATARWISSLYHIPLRDKGQLFQTPYNIRLGAAYLSQLAKSYHDHPLLMVAAYNAGPTQVHHWLSSYPLKQPDIWIEVIPYAETRNYLKNVIAFYQVYQHRLQQPSYLDYFMQAYQID